MGDLRGGVLVIDKRPGLTSHDVVHIVRRALGGARVGHTGTLDPFATGVLALVVGHATRLAQFYAGADKEYAAEIRLGTATDTYDGTGAVTGTRPDGLQIPDRDRIARALAAFEGTHDQVPPPFSAKKAGGIPSYERARRGLAVTLRPVQVTAHALELTAVAEGVLQVRVHCSAGYYVRSLAHDLGAALGVCGHLAALRRTRSGPFTIGEALDLEVVLREPEEALRRLVPLESLLPEIPGIRLNADGVRRVRHGMAIGAAHALGRPETGALPARARLLGPDGVLLAVADLQPGGLLHPGLVLG